MKLLKRVNKPLIIVSLLFWGSIIIGIYTSFINDDQQQTEQTPLHERSLLSTDDCYPKKKPYYLLPFYIFGVFYMFIALSIIVDEFFVPSLEVIAEKWELSHDVAGATLMAAGGSAPELFTSFFGTFQESEIGFAAIVGSAVFNVLFVIAVCAFSVDEPLSLTWFPLARDCIYYILSLGILSLFFVGIGPSEITWIEATILLILYIGYIILMRYNERIYDKWFKRETESTHNVPLGIKVNKERNSSTDDERHSDDEINDNKRSSNSNDNSDDESIDDRRAFERQVAKRGSFQAGIVAMMLRGNLKMERNTVNEQFLESMFEKMDKNGNGVIEKKDFEFDFENATEREIMEWIKDMDHDDDNKIDMNEFKEYYFMSQKNTHLQWLKPPKGIKNLIWYILTIILLVAFTLTIPDVRVKSNEKWRYFSFIISIAWVGGFSYFMVEWASVVGDTLKIPVAVMGLTILAAGTSVPDLLSSVVVAKQGHGDMAVSSSIGSNIFDVLVGLPLPWLAYTIIKGKNVEVASDGLGLSVVILLAMIICVIVSIYVSNWRMTKKLGGGMFILYFVFIGQDLARSNWKC